PASTPPVAPVVTQTASTTVETEELVMQPAASTRPRAAFGVYCLVTLIDGREHVHEDAGITTVYRTHTLKFAARQAKKAFDTTPEAYWPMIDGYCAVSYMERGDIQPGDPEWAAVFRGRVWFFVDEASRNRFAERPAAFVPENAR